MRETVTIDALEYEQLLKDSFILKILMDNGVENWEGYEKALS